MIPNTPAPARREAQTDFPLLDATYRREHARVELYRAYLAPLQREQAVGSIRQSLDDFEKALSGLEKNPPQVLVIGGSNTFGGRMNFCQELARAPGQGTLRNGEVFIERTREVSEDQSRLVFSLPTQPLATTDSTLSEYTQRIAQSQAVVVWLDDQFTEADASFCRTLIRHAASAVPWLFLSSGGDQHGSLVRTIEQGRGRPADNSEERLYVDQATLRHRLDICLEKAVPLLKQRLDGQARQAAFDGREATLPKTGRNRRSASRLDAKLLPLERPYTRAQGKLADWIALLTSAENPQVRGWRPLAAQATDHIRQALRIPVARDLDQAASKWGEGIDGDPDDAQFRDQFVDAVLQAAWQSLRDSFQRHTSEQTDSLGQSVAEALRHNASWFRRKLDELDPPIGTSPLFPLNQKALNQYGAKSVLELPSQISRMKSSHRIEETIKQMKQRGPKR